MFLVGNGQTKNAMCNPLHCPSIIKNGNFVTKKDIWWYICGFLLDKLPDGVLEHLSLSLNLFYYECFQMPDGASTNLHKQISRGDGTAGKYYPLIPLFEGQRLVTAHWT